MALIESANASLVGTTLVSNTTLCEASRVLTWQSRSHTSLAAVTAVRILDLLSLIDASVLYDRLYTLPGKLSSDSDLLALRLTLIECGAVEQFATAEARDLAAQALLGMLSTEKKLGKMPSTYVDELQRRASRVLAPGSEELAYEGTDLGFDGMQLGVNSFTELARRIMGRISDGETGRYQFRDPARALCYALVAEKLPLPFWPSVYYRPMLAEFPNYFSRSVRTAIYRRLSDTLQSTVDALASEFEGIDAYIPPFSALVLQRAHRPEDIPVAMLDLRQEYAGFRRKMAELEFERASAQSIASRSKTLGHIESLCREVCRPFDSPTPMQLKGSLKYVPDIVELATAPANPATWTRVLLEKPAEWLVTWYRRRPVVKLVKTAKEVAALSSYNDLLEKHFGTESVAAVRYSRHLIESLAQTRE